MKNNYNPYLVPESFFEDSKKQVIKNYRNRRRTIRYGIAAMLLLALLVSTPVFIHTTDNEVQEVEETTDNLAIMYDYDIFLQVNFIN